MHRKKKHIDPPPPFLSKLYEYTWQKMFNTFDNSNQYLKLWLIDDFSDAQILFCISGKHDVSMDQPSKIAFKVKEGDIASEKV